MRLIDVENEDSMAAIFQVIPNSGGRDIKEAARVFPALASTALRKAEQSYENEENNSKASEAHESMVLNEAKLRKRLHCSVELVFGGFGEAELVSYKCANSRKIFSRAR